jgi:hypothetical protein
VTADSTGNLYFYEIGTDGLYLYDTQGRFAKVASEAEHNLFQQSNGYGPNDNFLDIQARTSDAPGFAVIEIIYQDDAVDAPVGVLAYRVGDFNRDNSVDADDLALFGEALGTRGEAATEEEFVFDLNGNAVVVFDPEDNRYEHVSGGPAVVDWKDVKVLQQFTLLLDGDANLDGAVDFLDLDIVSENYYTNPTQTMETWIDGDFASIDPDYALDAMDANLVNEVDLAVLAGTWTDVLAQPVPTEMQLMQRGYTQSFIDDVLDAFADMPGVGGDYNLDGVVNLADYVVWRDSLGATGSGLAADGSGDGIVEGDDFEVWKNAFNPGGSEVDPDFNGDGIVNLADYTVWRDSLGASGNNLPADGNGDMTVNHMDYVVWKNAFGQPGSAAGSLTATTSVPEPTAGLVMMFSVVALVAVARYLDAITHSPEPSQDGHS